MNKLLCISALAALTLAALPAAAQTTAAAAPAAAVSPIGTAPGDAGVGHSGGKAAMCIGCHGIPGYKMAFPHVYHVPMIAGQNPKYIENALKAYRSGERKHPTMRSIASSLSDADIAELAAYYGQPEGK
ncbi:MAG TPA: cytochrome c [Burkholderiales bacterium]|jgi:cytochrome c553|nr:cytochrome c [Burkholderiales bacterium]